MDPKSAAGTAAAFSKPNKDALLMANSSLLFEYASQELLQFLDHRYGNTSFPYYKQLTGEYKETDPPLSPFVETSYTKI